MPVADVATMLAAVGRKMVGGVVSLTATLNVAWPVLPWVSVALQVTPVTPSGNVDPEAGEQLTAPIGPSTASTAVGVGKLTTDPAGPFASTALSP